MKTISYNEEKRIIILEKRGIDLHIIANLIAEGEIIDKRMNPNRA